MHTPNKLFGKTRNATQRLVWACCVPLLTLATACTPALNWRDVSLDRLKVQLPCKPDRAQRPVELQGVSLPLSMAGCKAADALFAVSHTQIPGSASVQSVLSAWQNATLQNMQVQGAAEVLAAYNSNQKAPATSIAQVAPLQVTGVNPEGGAIQAQLVWFVVDRDVYHMAIYAPVIKPEMTETLFAQAQLQ
jgi:hypothetical protein